MHLCMCSWAGIVFCEEGEEGDNKLVIPSFFNQAIVLAGMGNGSICIELEGFTK